MKNLNDLLDYILTKYLVRKSTQLWDKFLSQTLFATCVQLHVTTCKSPFYLVYSIESCISGDDNMSLSSDTQIENWEECITNVNHAQSAVNELLLNRAVKMQWIRDELVKTTDLESDT